MKIGILVEYLNARGGTQRQALELASHLGKIGHEVDVVTTCFDREKCFPELTAGMSIKACREVSATTAPSAAGSPTAVRRALRLASRLSGGLHFQAYRQMRRSEQQYTAFAQGLRRAWDVVNPHDFGPAAWVASQLARSSGAAIVWQCNDPLLRWGRDHLPLARLARGWLVEQDRRRVASIEYVTALDGRVARLIQERYGVQPRIVRSGVDLETFRRLPAKDDARGALEIARDARVILVLTLLNSPHRRVEDAIAAHAACPSDVILLLAASGGGGYARRVERAVSESSARERIVWRRAALGGEEELRLLFAASDVFVFPNVNQTWGLAVIEAASAGLPVVVSDQSGVSEVFRNGIDGIIYPGGDQMALARAVVRLMEDEAARQRLSVAGARMVQARYSWRRYARDMEAVFHEAIQARLRSA